MHPDDILLMFKDRWVGTEDQLLDALELFADDLLDSVKQAGGTEEMIKTTRDYLGNHYGA